MRNGMHVCGNCYKFDSADYRRKLNGRKKNTDWENDGFYNNFLYDKNFWKSKEGYIAFDDESGLGLEAPMMIRFLVEKKWKFYFVSVKAHAFRIFRQNISLLMDKVQIAPFWCLCEQVDPSFNLYKDIFKKEPFSFALSPHQLRSFNFRPKQTFRHMILLTTDSELFDEVWERIYVPADENSMEKKIIKNPLQLSTLIVNLSSYHATSKIYSADSYCFEHEKGCDDYCSFYYNRPVYPHANYALSTLYKSGLDNLLKSERSPNMGNINISLDQNDKIKYFSLFRDLNDFISKCPIPLREGFELSASGDYVLHVVNEKVLKFTYNSNLPKLNHLQRFIRLVELGICLTDCIDFEPYYFSGEEEAKAEANFLKYTENKKHFLKMKKELLLEIKKLEQAHCVFKTRQILQDKYRNGILKLRR